jgi:hypothetical protein
MIDYFAQWPRPYMILVLLPPLLLLLLLPGPDSPLPPASLEQLQGGSSSQHGSGGDQDGLHPSLPGSPAALGEPQIGSALHFCCGSVLWSCQLVMPAAVTACQALCPSYPAAG